MTEVKEDKPKITLQDIIEGEQKSEFTLDLGSNFVDRKTWEVYDDYILNSKLRRTRAHKKLYSRARIYFQFYNMFISILSMVFTSIPPIISISSIYTGNVAVIQNVFNIITGIIAIFLHIIEKILNYGYYEDQCIKIINACNDLEDEINDILRTPTDKRNKASDVMSRMDTNYDKVRRKCTYIKLSSRILNSYKHDILLEIDKLKPQNKSEYIDDYLIPFGDSPII